MEIPTPAPTPGAGAHPAQGAAGELRALRARLDLVRSEAHAVDTAALVQDLETAYEELRVADDETRAQQLQISTLLDDHRTLRYQHERMLAALPVPVFSTDAQGIVRSVNAAASAALRTRVDQLLGKPAFAHFRIEDRGELRGLLSRQRADSPPFHRAVTLVEQAGGATVDLTVTSSFAESEAGHRTWMLLPGAGGAATGPALPIALAQLATLPVRTESLGELLPLAAESCRQALGRDVHVSLTMGSPREPTAVGTTSVLAQEMDGAQIRAEQGPCVDAFETAAPVQSPDVRRDPRWPALGPLVPPGVGAVIAVPLEVGERLVGALNVYRADTEVGEPPHETADLLAATVASVLYEVEVRRELRELTSHMERALDSRAVIDQAKGILMGRHGWDAERAFAELVQQSSVSGLKVREIARLLVDRTSGIS